jgi:hypothetical protein
VPNSLHSGSNLEKELYRSQIFEFYSSSCLPTLRATLPNEHKMASRNRCSSIDTDQDIIEKRNTDESEPEDTQHESFEIGEEEYPIKCIITESRTKYLIDWEGPYYPTWVRRKRNEVIFLVGSPVINECIHRSLRLARTKQRLKLGWTSNVRGTGAQSKTSGTFGTILDENDTRNRVDCSTPTGLSLVLTT